jgi:hypothetical protein
VAAGTWATERTLEVGEAGDERGRAVDEAALGFADEAGGARGDAFDRLRTEGNFSDEDAGSEELGHSDLRGRERLRGQA